MKDKQINLRLSQELYNMLQLKSKASNMTASNYIRTSINSSQIKIDNSKDIGKLIGAINKIGNNINQIAYTLNKANNNNELNNIDYNNILDKLIIIEHQQSELLKSI